MTASLFLVVLGPTGFQVVLVASQWTLVISVVVLLVIWWMEWRNGRVW